MEDRILLIPAGFAPEPEAMVDLAAFRALLRRLEEFLPLDIFRFPWLKGEEPCEPDPVALAERMAQAIRPEHHVVDIGTGAEILLTALSQRPARSLVVAGFLSSEATLRGCGEPSVAASVAAISALSLNPTQIVPLVMAGADDALVQGVMRKVEASVNKDLFAASIRRFNDIDYTGTLRLTLPTLYLNIAFPLAGADTLFEVFRAHVPGAASETLHEWPMRLQEEGAGHELADKVIPFIEGVINARRAR